MEKKKTLMSVVTGALLLVSLSFGSGISAAYKDPVKEDPGHGGSKPPACTTTPCLERP